MLGKTDSKKNPVGRFCLWVIGCQYNEYDGARLSYVLKKMGLEESEPESADVILILACSVRQTAIDRIFGKLKHWKGKRILISGCILPADKKRFNDKGVEFFDPADLENLPRALGIRDRNTLKYFKDGAVESEYVPIMTGCNNFCTYCAVPYTRGRERSRPFDEVVRNAEILVKSGAKEVMLLGQNVNSYEFGFSKLLKTINDLTGKFTISFISNHPKDMSDEIIEAVARLPKVKKEIHLPLQSGSDRILKLMNRPYKVEDYLQIIESIKLKVKGVKISTDVIVGFPGEAEKDFQKTVEVFKRVGYFKAYINKYSPRAGTAAYKLGDPTSWPEKQRRWRILNSLVPGNRGIIDS